ncbi:AMP-binding enzyme [Cupriavidus necator]|uniref:AMP-binding enzyme n=1 Tax=Cupriavidus necator TaxID=106590 RepID=UPI001E40A586|nr:hypothetical protein [Cupriavidus necator]
MLIRGGENIYPREIEEFLFRHPKVQAVQVFGVPDQKYGESALDRAQTRPDGHRGRNPRLLPRPDRHYKIPRYIRFVSEMPMTVTGKVQKFVMRDTMIHDLGLKPGASA